MKIQDMKTQETKTNESTIKTLKVKSQSFIISKSTCDDVKIACSYNKDQAGEWIYNVDPQSYGEIKSIWLQLNDMNLSIYNVFCFILKIK